MQHRSRIRSIWRPIASCVAVVLLLASLGGCGTAFPNLEFPTLLKTSERKLLTKEEQAKAMADLEQQKTTQTAEALKQIEKGK